MKFYCENEIHIYDLKQVYQKERLFVQSLLYTAMLFLFSVPDAPTAVISPNPDGIISVVLSPPNTFKGTITKYKVCTCNTSGYKTFRVRSWVVKWLDRLYLY